MNPNTVVELRDAAIYHANDAFREASFKGHKGVQNLILSDEPTGNLDPAAADGLMQLLRWIVSRGCAVLMSTHNISNIQQYPSRTLRFNQGRVEEIDMQSILGI